MKRVYAGFGYYHWPDPGVAWSPNAANRKGQHPGQLFSLEDQAAVVITTFSEDSCRGIFRGR